MHAQTNRRILSSHRQGDLRKAPTDAERVRWSQVRRRQLHGCKFRRQHPYADYILDFVCIERKLVIEVDGSQHADSERDLKRDAILEAAGFRVLRFWNHDVLTRTTDVLEAVLHELEQRLTVTQPSPPQPSP